MIENKELYSYIIHSLDILNRSLTISEQNNIKLFSYIYNNQTNIINDIKNIDNNYNNLILNNGDIDKKIDNFEKCIITFDNKIKNLEDQIVNLKNSIQKYNENIIEVPVIIDDLNKKSKILQLLYNYYIYSKNFIISLFNKCYKFIFKKRIQKKLKEQEEIYRQKQIEKQNQEFLERKRKIREILNTTIKR